jgi:hypothetical protein
MRALLLILVLALAACGTTRALDRLKDLNAAGDLAAIAASEVGCTGPDDPACLQAREIKANACLRLGIAALAPGSGRAAEVPGLLDCAVANYRTALAAGPSPLPAADRARLAAGYLLALRERRDQARNAAEAITLNTALAEEAARTRAALPGSALGFHYGAAASYARATLAAETPGARCPPLADAASLAAAAPPPEAGLAPAHAALVRAIGADRRRFACP